MGKLVSGKETGISGKNICDRYKAKGRVEKLEQAGYVKNKIAAAQSSHQLDVIGVTGNNLSTYLPTLIKQSAFDLLISPHSPPKQLMLEYYCFTVIGIETNLDDMIDINLNNKYKYIQINPTDNNPLFWTINAPPELAITLALNLMLERNRYTNIRIKKLE